MKYLTAREVCQKVAPFLGLSFDNDQDKLFLYLDIAQKRAWRAGTYKGFLKIANVSTYEFGGHRYIRTPHGYNVLLGLNINSKPKELKEGYFQFHHNSYGSLSKEQQLRYVDYGLVFHEYPTLMGPQLNRKDFKFQVGVLSTVDREGYAQISGIGIDGNPINTVVDGESFDGVKVKLSKGELTLIDNVWWSDIEGISKDQTFGAVEFYAINKTCNYAELIARIEPRQKVSQYRLYEVPKDCGCGQTVEALFKLSEPDQIVSGDDKLIIDDIEAIMSLMIGADETFNKKAIEVGEAFSAKGVVSLAEEERAASSPTVQPIQFVGIDVNEEDYVTF